MKYSVTKLLRSITVVKVVSVLSIGLSIVVLLTATASHLLPQKYLFAAICLLAILDTATALAFCIPKTKKRLQVIALCFVIVTIGIYSLAMYGLVRSITLISNVTGDSSVIKKDINQLKPFNFYISGIDTYGDITTVSRSDANIVASVNPETKRILLTTIPRDSYVRIADGGNNQYDKLTHAGNYGVLSSMKTVAALLDINLETYARINFSSFIGMIDEIGGVDVSNPVQFKTDFGQVFAQGTLHLNGKDALTFSRERHNLSGGDNDRGLNQERVITAIFNKVSSPSVLSHYNGILNVIGQSIQTNLSPASLTALINQQLNDAGSWKIETTTIEGKGQTGGLPSYAMPASQLYMFVLNEQSLKQVQDRIRSQQNTSIN